MVRKLGHLKYSHQKYWTSCFKSRHVVINTYSKLHLSFLLFQLYVSQFPDTTYIILRRDIFGVVSYPLQNGQIYAVEVSHLLTSAIIVLIFFSYQVMATNSAGSGPPSSTVTFTVNGMIYVLSAVAKFSSMQQKVQIKGRERD